MRRLAGTWRKKCLRVPSGSGVALIDLHGRPGVRGEPVAAPQDSGLVLGHTGGAAERHVTFRRHDLDHAAADLDVDLLVDHSQRDPGRSMIDAPADTSTPRQAQIDQPSG